MRPQYNIDVLNIRNGRCFGWGWFLDEASPARRCTLIMKMHGGAEQRIACVFSGMRMDLRDAFPQVPHAAGAGFMIQSHLEGEPLPDAPARLEVVLADGRVEVREIAMKTLQAVVAGASTGWSRFRSAVGAWWKKVGDIGIFPATTVALRRLIEIWRARSRALPDRLSALRSRETVLVFDHDMGGGANRYRRDFVLEKVSSGRTVVVIVPRLSSLDYSVTIHAPGRKVEESHVDDPALALAVLSTQQELDVHVNELVSFHDPMAILAWCVEARSGIKTRLTFHLHDYYAACPSWNLMDDVDRYCGVPAMERCHACLPSNITNTMGFTRDTDLVRWRSHWGAFLERCDEIVAFSTASVAILRLAHPTLDSGRVRLRPHRIDATILRPVTPNPGPPVVIAVAGHVSRAKGADMLREMAALLRLGSQPARIVVFGTLEGHSETDPIDVRGSFEPSQLPMLLERAGASVCFLPSICAETFSFVTDEYMAMGMPVAVFPIGAPAERVVQYVDGMVISRIDAETAVREILEFVGRPRSPNAH